MFDGISKEGIASLKEPEEQRELDSSPVDRAMGSGGLDMDRHNRQQDMGMQDPELGSAGGNPHSLSPSGPQQSHGGHPADRFIGSTPDDQKDLPNPFELELQKIRQFVGYQNFGVDLKPGNDGTLSVTLTPPQGAPVDVGGLLQSMQKHLGGAWKGESTPASSTGGPIKFQYTPEGMSADSPVQDKVEKGGEPYGAPTGGAPGNVPGEIQQTV